MAVALDVAGTFQEFAGAPSPVTYTNLTTGLALSNGAIIAMFMSQYSTGAPSISSVTWGGQAMEPIAAATGLNSTSNAKIFMYGLTGISNFGAQNLVITTTGGSFDWVVQACSWTGVNQTGGTTSFAHGNLTTGTDATPTVVITSAVGNAVMACFMDASTGSVNSTNNTQIFVDNNLNINTGGLRAAGAASVSCTAALADSTSPWVAAGCDIVTVGVSVVFKLEDASLDGGLTGIKTNANQIYVCTGQPTSYADAVTKLVGAKDLGAGNVLGALAAGSPSGRKASTPAVTGGTVSTNGTPAAWAIVDSANSILYASGPLSGGVAVTTNDNWTLEAITLHMNK